MSRSSETRPPTRLVHGFSNYVGLRMGGMSFLGKNWGIRSSRSAYCRYLHSCGTLRCLIGRSIFPAIYVDLAALFDFTLGGSRSPALFTLVKLFN